MKNVIEIAHRKLTDIMWNFIVAGILMLVLAVLVVWTEVVLQLLVGLFVLIVAYCLFYVACKIHSIRKHLE